MTARRLQILRRSLVELSIPGDVLPELISSACAPAQGICLLRGPRRYRPCRYRSSVHHRPADNPPRWADISDHTLDCRDRAPCRLYCGHVRLINHPDHMLRQSELQARSSRPTPFWPIGARVSLDEVVGQDRSARPRRNAHPDAGARLALFLLADPLGSAGLRQDHHRPPARRPVRAALRPTVGGVLGVADLKRAFDEGA